MKYLFVCIQPDSKFFITYALIPHEALVKNWPENRNPVKGAVSSDDYDPYFDCDQLNGCIVNQSKHDLHWHQMVINIFKRLGLEEYKPMNEMDLRQFIVDGSRPIQADSIIMIGWAA